MSKKKKTAAILLDVSGSAKLEESLVIVRALVKEGRYNYKRIIPFDDRCWEPITVDPQTIDKREYIEKPLSEVGRGGTNLDAGFMGWLGAVDREDVAVVVSDCQVSCASQSKALSGQVEAVVVGGFAAPAHFPEWIRVRGNPAENSNVNFSWLADLSFTDLLALRELVKTPGALAHLPKIEQPRYLTSLAKSINCVVSNKIQQLEGQEGSS